MKTFRESTEANKPDLIQVSLSTKITQDNNCTEQSNINDDHTEFIPGSIHQEKVREFWIKELKAGDWVLNVLEEGYIIPFTKAPAAYEEPNNASANKDPVFVHQAVTELATLGIIQFTKEKPLCVSPLTVSHKRGRDGSIKKRLCWDGSRCVNLCLQEQTVTLSHFQKALELTRPKDFQVIYDLKSAYHHIKIHRSQTKYLGAAIRTPEGTIIYFTFLFLPFGLSSAVHCITKLFKPINAYLHNKGIRHSIYLDDGRITSDTKCQAEKDRSIVYDILKKSGWIIEKKKSDQENDASQCKEYLGFIIDTDSMTVRLSEAKKQHTIQQVLKTIAYGPKPILAKELAGTLGKMVSTEPALGPVVIMAARAAYIELDAAVQGRRWSTFLTMSTESLNGLNFFVENFSNFDNSLIRSAATEISVLSIIGPPSSFMKSSFVSNHA